MSTQKSSPFHILGLATWPFRVVPDPGELLFWAGRPILLRQIRRLLRQLEGHRSSSLHLLWADFGAGKTHTLLYLRQLAIRDSSSAVVPIYTVLPRACNSFVDIYRAIIGGIGIETLQSAHDRARIDRRTNPRDSMAVYTIPGLHTALESLRIGNELMKQTATRWLLADPSLTRKELYDASLPNKIRSTDDALAILSSLTQLMLKGESRLLLMIDEFQRAGMLRRASLEDINAGLHTYFNSCPNNLSIILSFSFGSARNIQYHLNEELRSRADPTVLTIPQLDLQSGEEFLGALLQASTIPNSKPVIDQQVLHAITGHVHQQGGITPRKLMQAANTVFSEARMDLEDGTIEVVEPQYALDILRGVPEDSAEEEE